jgi:peptide/nickel transport system permease protein
MPGDPARLALGSMATKEMVEDMREQMHLDKPIPVQYYYWFSGVLRGDFGKSMYSYRSVNEDIKDFFPATLELVLFSLVILVLFGLVFGVLSAAFKDTWIDHTIRLMAYAFVSVPYFVWALFLLLIFGYFLDILPTAGRLSVHLDQPRIITGLITIDSLIAGKPRIFFDAVKHLILPAVSLTAGGLATAARVTRSSMSANMSKDYIQVARLYRIPNALIFTKYLLRPSVIPTVALLGMQLGVLLGKAFVVEVVFNWPGLSWYGVRTILNKDLNAITAVVLLIGCVYIVMNFIVDVFVGWLDPRISLQSK